MANELAELENRQFLNIAQSLLPFATDTSLDLIGEIFGVPRITQQTASVDIGDQNFQWYVRNGTFGSINSGQDIVIPSGVRIYTASPSGPVYVGSPVTLPAAAGSQYFSASSLYSGASGNAASGIFTQHNFTNYTESRYGSLLVTNNYGIVSGRDDESDDDYRYRIRLKLQSQNGANEAALRFAILQVPGIQDVVFAPQAGTFTCYVYGIAADASASLLQSVQQTINGTVAFPLTGTAVAPDLVGISLTTTITLTASASATDQASIIANAFSARSGLHQQSGDRRPKKAPFGRANRGGRRTSIGSLDARVSIYSNVRCVHWRRGWQTIMIRIRPSSGMFARY